MSAPQFAAEETAYVHIANTGVQSQSAKRRGEAAMPTRPGGMTDEPHTNVPLPIVDGDQPVRPQRESRPVTFFDGTTWRGTTTEPTTLDPDAAPDTTRVNQPSNVPANKTNRIARLRSRQRRSPEPPQTRWEEITWLIASLRDVITKQERMIEGIRTNLAALQRQNETLQGQNETLQDQNEALSARVDELGNRIKELQEHSSAHRSQNETLKEGISALKSELQTLGTNRPSWAAIAAQGNTTAPGRPPSVNPSPSQQANEQKLPGISLDLSGVISPQFQISNTKEIRDRVRQAFNSHANTKDIGWFGIARTGADPNRVKICLRTHEEAARIKRHDEWLQSHFRGARVQGEQWYPVKVDRVNKASICDDSRIHLREDAGAKIGAENGVVVRKLRFIGRPNPDKLHCSVVLFLASKQEAEELIRRKYLDVDEPYLFRNQDGEYRVTPQSHPYWTPFLPEHTEGSLRPRAMLWTHRDITARPISTESTDIAALLIELETGPLLAISVYIPAKSDSEDSELNSRLDIIRRTIDTTRRNHDKRVEILIAGDFNRHDQFWGGDLVATSQRQGEGEPIIQLMSELDLQCPLPRGIETWISYNGEHSSTIDLILVTQELASEIQRCTTDSMAHGSDHLAICTEFAIDLTHEKGTPRKLWKKARWDPIRKVVAGELERRSQPDIPGDVDSYCQFVTECIAPAIEKYVPVARPSPYAKRWWTEDLTELRKHYTYWRNKASASRRANTPDPGLQQMAVTCRKRYHDAIRNQRKTHWQDFVAEARNIWTIARYLDPAQCATFARIPAIKTYEGRIGTQAIIGAFRTVALIRAEMEAGIEQLTARMHRQEYKFWVKCHTLPVNHPWWKIRRGIDTKNKRFPSPLQRIAMQLDSVDLTEMERIDPFCIPPWQQGIEAQILEGEEAQKWAEDSDELKVFVDASYRGHNAGVGVYHSARRSDNSVVEHREAVKIGKNAGYTSTHVELTAIQAALELISAIWSPDTIARFGNKARDLTYVIIKLEKPVDIDTALPGKHTKSIYDLQTYKRAAVLCQLRTGKCRLNSYLAKIGATNSDRCTCRGRQPETVRHFVFECPLWKEERKTLQEVAGNRWGDLSFFLGGRSEQRLPSGELLDGKAESWKPNLDVVNQTIEFAMATGRLC
ncbi:hypothetical protein PMIN01_12895 [Paraphaeosphaeria minitans]|uniref:Endonuclease/exonuclease/phosphatase domain-containing protein n=1 Tax=Paraphaeosphaeria minitans TaxID=565426 RepID=A0A9P6KJW1_9PLEO|nr:hypothetical protein PMIN01_12895 [Paraphaeosphaeria minitans]